jgi:hypothetical protein
MGILRNIDLSQRLGKFLLSTDQVQIKGPSQFFLDFIDDDIAVMKVNSNSHKRGDNFGPFCLIYANKEWAAKYQALEGQTNGLL